MFSCSCSRRMELSPMFTFTLILHLKHRIGDSFIINHVEHVEHVGWAALRPPFRAAKAAFRCLVCSVGSWSEKLELAI